MDLTTKNGSGTVLVVNNSNQSTLDLQPMSAFVEAFLLYEKVATGFSVCGIYGNLVSVYIFWTHRGWQHPCNLFLFALAFADIGVIFWRGLLGGYLGNRFLKSSDGLCKVINYMWQASAFTSSWLIVAYSVERFTAIIKPHWFRKVNSRHAKITIGLIVCLAFTFFIPELIVFRVMDIPGSRICLYDPGVSGQETLTFLLIFEIVLNYALPCIFLVVLNVFIIWGLGRQNKMAVDSMRSNSKNKMRSRKITLNLVFISFLYILVALPFVIVWTIYMYCLNICERFMDEPNRTYINSTLSRTSAPIKTNIGLSVSDLWGLGRLFLSVTVFNNCFNFVCYSMNLDFFRMKFLRILTCGLYTSKRQRNPPFAPENVDQYCNRDDGISALPLRQMDPVGSTEVISSCATSAV